MSPSPNFTKRFASILIAVFIGGEMIGHAQTPAPKPTPRELTGLWKDSDGKLVKIQGQEEGQLTASLVEADQCPFEGTRKDGYLTGTLTNHSFTGTMKVCTKGDIIFKEANAPGQFDADVKGSINSELTQLTCTYEGEHWQWDEKDGKKSNFRVTSHPTKSYVLTRQCNEDLIASYQRRWQASQDLFQASSKHLQEAQDEFRDWKREEAKTMTEIAGEKYDLLQTVELALAEGGKHLLHKATGWFGLATTAAWIYTDVYPHTRDHNKAVLDAVKMSDRAVTLADEAIADLKKDSKEYAECEELRKQIEKDTAQHERLMEQAKALREEWGHEGSALYKDTNDPNAYPMDAKAALDRALQILSSPSANSTSSASTPLPSSETPTLQSLTSQANSSDGLTVTAEQARAAIEQVDSAIRMMDSGRQLQARRRTAAQRWGADLAALSGKVSSETVNISSVKPKATPTRKR